MRIVFEEYIHIFSYLRTTKRLTDRKELYTLQTHIDNMCDTYIRVFGTHNITNYLHDLQCGHILYFLQTYQNIYIHANISFEATIGHTCSKVLRGTQRGGHGGKKGEKKSVVFSMREHITQKAVFSLSKVSDSTPEQYIIDLVSSCNSSSTTNNSAGVENNTASNDTNNSSNSTASAVDE